MSPLDDVVPDGRPAWGGRLAQRLTADTLAWWGRQCHLCSDTAPATTADHVIPRSKGGADDVANLRPAHLACNQARGDRWLWEWFAANPVKVTSTRLPPTREW